jgi:hypothetical protein
LILDEEIRKVTFHTDMLAYMLDVLVADSIIRNEEVVTIDKTLLDYYRDNMFKKDRFAKTMVFLDSLKKLPFFINEDSVKLHSYSSLLFHIVRNRMIDSADLVRIDDRNHAVLDSVWHSNLFVDLELDNELDSLKKKKEFHDSLNADLQRFVTDLRYIYNQFEMEIDTSYFDQPVSNSVKLDRIIQSAEESLRR